MSDGKSNAWINSSNTNIRRLYSEVFDKHQQSLSEELRSCRVNLNLLSTVDSLYNMVNSYFLQNVDLKIKERLPNMIGVDFINIYLEFITWMGMAKKP